MLSCFRGEGARLSGGSDSLFVAGGRGPEGPLYQLYAAAVGSGALAAGAFSTSFRTRSDNCAPFDVQ